MRYRVKLFALLRERCGDSLWEFESDRALKGSELIGAFFEDQPSLQGLRKVTRLAVNQAFREDDPTLEETDELALIPPVSGG